MKVIAFKTAAELTPGDRTSMGTFVSVRFSKSGKTAYKTIKDHKGNVTEWPGVSSTVRHTVFSQD